MLRPGEQRLLTDAVKPPIDHRLDHAFISTYSLDLTALFSIPLALTFGDWEGEGGRPAAGPFALLEAIRRTASKFTVFCQPGEIAVPSPRQRVLAFLEPAIREVPAPLGGVFHPKLWVLRYVPLDEFEGPPVYRVICASRNLTFDRSWDVMLVLEGELTRRTRAMNKPLASFVDDVMTLANGGPDPLDGERREALETIVAELPKVGFEAPEGLELVAFHPLGTPNGSADPFEGRRDGMLVVSPFAGEERLGSLAGRGSVLVSAAAELDALESDPAELFDEVLVLSDLAVADALSEDSDGDGIEPEAAEQTATTPRERLLDSAAGLLRGLHAKVYAADDGWRGRLWVGSANATTAAFGSNVEVLVELGGKRPAKPAGILGTEEDGLRQILTPYRRRKATEADSEMRDAEFLAGDVLHRLGAASPALAASEQDGVTYVLELRDMPRITDPEVRALTARPATVQPDRHVDLLASSRKHSWSGLDGTQLTAFLVLRVGVQVGEATVEREATIRARLEGAPEDRDSQIIRSIIRSPEQFLLYLAFLLADPDRDPVEAQRLANALDEEPPDGARLGGIGPFPVLESMVRAVGQDPESIDRIAKLLEDMRAADDGNKLIPDDFESVWEPILAAHREIEAEG